MTGLPHIWNKRIIFIFILTKSQKVVYKNIAYSVSLLFGTLFHTKMISMGRNGVKAWRSIIRH